MAEETKKPGRPRVYRAKVSGVIANGKGGHFKEGEELPKGVDIVSLQAKGLI